MVNYASVSCILVPFTATNAVVNNHGSNAAQAGVKKRPLKRGVSDLLLDTVSGMTFHVGLGREEVDSRCARSLPALWCLFLYSGACTR